MHNVILDASARAAFVTAWADAEEEAGHHHGGEELMDIAPETPPEARKWAWSLWQKIFKLNVSRFAGFQLGGKHEEPLANWIEAAWAHAADASGIDFHDEEEATEFGHYVAMQAMGHGVAWEDDHEEKGFELPYVEGMIVEAGEGEEERENPDWRKLGGHAKRGMRAGVQLTKRGARATAQAAREFHAGWRENPRVNGRAHPVSATQAHEIMSAAGVEQSPGAHSIPVGASVLYDMGKNRWSFEGPTDDVEYWLGLSTRENPAKRFPRSTTIQTLVFDADSFTPAQATSWAEAHDFKATKVDEKENTLRLRQAPPTAFVTSTFRTIPLDDGVQAVVGMPKKGA